MNNSKIHNTLQPAQQGLYYKGQHLMMLGGEKLIRPLCHTTVPNTKVVGVVMNKQKIKQDGDLLKYSFGEFEIQTKPSFINVIRSLFQNLRKRITK